jgi:hypothetical protein
VPKQRNLGQFGRPTYNQAAKVIARFGSEAKLANAIGISRISCFRWQYKRPAGSDGLIPTLQIAKIKAVARAEGILIRDEDWVPEINNWDGETGELAKVTRKRKTLAELLS